MKGCYAMKKYRIIAFSIAVMICTGVLSSCDKEKENSNSSGSGSSVNASTDASDASSMIVSGAAEELQDADKLQDVSSLPGAVNIAGTGSNGSKSASNASSSAITSAGIGTVDITDEDTSSEWKESNSCSVVFSDSGATAKGSGASISGGKVTITVPGNYVFSGSSANGQIIVNTVSKGSVHIILNGLNLACLSSSPIYIQKCDKAIISLAAGTTNTIADTKNYIFDSAETNEPSSAVYSKSDLTVNGSGSLTVNANYNDGITCNDTLLITGGSITVNSVDDGITARDAMVISNATININANGDGLCATNNNDASKGFLQIESGTFYITSGADALQAVTGIIIKGGNFNISSGGGSASAKTQQSSGLNNRNGAGASADEDDEQSAKAVKSGTLISIIGGNFVIDSADDALHSNGNITIDGGKFNMLSGDDGIHADIQITITGGYIEIGKSYEGIEASVIEIRNGIIDITASDDGINVGGGTDDPALGGRPGQDNFNSAAAGTRKMTVSGGVIKINAAGDGMDINGSLYVSGGVITIYGPTDNGNGALDYDGVFEISGGTLVAAGSIGMAQTPSSSSSQYSLSIGYSSVQSAGTAVKLLDSSGKEILSFTAAKQFQSVVISSPALAKGSTYTVVCGSAQESITVSGIVTSNGISGSQQRPGGFGR